MGRIRIGAKRDKEEARPPKEAEKEEKKEHRRREQLWHGQKEEERRLQQKDVGHAEASTFRASARKEEEGRSGQWRREQTRMLGENDGHHR